MNPLRILGLSGSPHPQGNTAWSVRHALGLAAAAGAETRYLSVAGRRLGHCVACWRCQSEGRCFQDDGAQEILDAMLWCDGLILGSPVCMGMVSAQLKTVMDRCVVFRPSYDLPLALDGKTGCGIACGAFRNGGQETTLQNIHTFLLQQNMRAVSDGPGFSHAGATVVGTASEDSLGQRTIANLVANLLRACAR